MFKFFILFLFSVPCVFANTISEIQVAPQSERSFVLESIAVDQGEEWNEQRLSLSLRFLRETQRYEDVAFEYSEQTGVLQVLVRPREFFDEVIWSGDRPEDASDIESRCLLEQEDASLPQDRINQITQCIRQQIRGQGFLDAQLFIYGEEKNLFIEVTLGQPYRVREIKFEGDLQYRPGRLKFVLENDEGDRFRANNLSEESLRIERFYRQRKFYNARVSAPELEVFPASQEVVLSFQVTPGIKTEFEFEGISQPPNILDELRSGDERAPSWFVDLVVDAIQNQFRSRGFIEVQVTREVEELNGLRRVKISVERGRQFILTEPEWVGLNDRESIRNIYSKLRVIRPGKAFNEEEYQEAIQEIFFPALVEKGYQDVEVRNIEFRIDSESARVTPVIFMNEGFPHLVGAVEVFGYPDGFEDLEERKDLLDALDKGEPFNEIRINELQANLRLALRDRGFLDLNIRREEEKLEGNRYLYRFVFETGPRYRISEILIKGLRRTKIEVISRELLFEEGDFYSTEDINDSISEILRLGITRSLDVRVFEKFPERGELYLMVEVFEAARFRFEIGPGYGTADGLRGVFRATYANIRGTGRRLSFFTKASRELEKEQRPDPSDFKDGDVSSVPFIERRITLEYFEPKVFDSAIDGRIALTHRKEERRNFAVLSNEAAFVLDYRINRNWTFSPEYKIEYSNPFNVVLAIETETVDDASSSRLHAVGFNLNTSYVDDTFSPSRGLRNLFRFELYDPRVGSDTAFWLLRTKTDFFAPVFDLPIGRPVGLALSVNTGFSDYYGESLNVPVEKRFRIGGENSVRGFPEDGIQPTTADGTILRNGGLSTFYLRSELNIPIVGSFDLLSFFDVGNIYATNSDFDPTDLRSGAGFGVRFNSPVGPVKLGYAFVLDQKDGEPVGQIYFGVGPI